MVRARSTYGGEEGAFRGLVGKPDGRRPFQRPWHRREDNIKMDPRELGLGARPGSIWLGTGTRGGILQMR
jgi:hypothetical protein